MTLVTVKAKENLIDGLTDKAVYKGGVFKMEADRAKENAELGYVEIVDGNPDLDDKPKREVGTFTVENIKPAEPEKIIQPVNKDEVDKLKVAAKGTRLEGKEEDIVRASTIASQALNTNEDKEEVSEVKRGRKPKTD